MNFNERVNIYYAGLDNYSLPLGDGERLISTSSKKQIDYIKLLCLFSDEVIVPPSFYLCWAGKTKKKKHLSQLIDLYQAGYISSSVHSTMSEPKDFLKYKLHYGTATDKKYTKKNVKILNKLFSEMPLKRRDVKVQSGGFREKVKSEILKTYQDSLYKKQLLIKIDSGVHCNGVITSREEVNLLHCKAYSHGLISKHELRKYYYTTNKCYYHQGAITYDSIISILDAHRYSILGRHIFETEHGILLGYDPQVIEGILNSFGISDRVISALTVQEISKIRNNTIFNEFKTQYKEFARELQKLNLFVSRLSKEKVSKAQILFKENFINKYFSQRDEYEKKMRYWALGEMNIFALSLGAIGFFVIPILGAILGFLPIVLWKTGLTPKIGEFIVNQVDEAKSLFYKFITELRLLSKEIEQNEQLQ